MEVVRSVVYTNKGAVTVFVGGSTVTTTDYGYELAAGASLALDLTRGDALFGVVASSTADVIGLHTAA